MTAELPQAPEGARRVFGGRLARAEDFAAILADTGVSHGLIGPREVPILWERHILNCAVIEDAFSRDARVVDELRVERSGQQLEHGGHPAPRTLLVVGQPARVHDLRLTQKLYLQPICGTVLVVATT